MAAETAILVTIATSLASGLLKELSKKAIHTVSKSSTVADLKSAFFKRLEPQLRLLQKELTKLDSVLMRVQCIDLTKCDQNNLVLLWLKSVKDAAFFADNLLGEMIFEKTRKQVLGRQSRLRRLVASIRLLQFRQRVARQVNKFMSMTAEIYKEAENTLNLAQLAGNAPIYQPTPTISADLRELRENPDTSFVLGREADEDLIVNKLCGPTNDNQLPVIAIVGRSGLGKTTLARRIYNNKTVEEHFGKKTWIFVSDHFNLERFLNEMLESVTGKNHKLTNKNAMEEKLQQCLQEEKMGYLLVLDDVWNTDKQLWESVENSLLRVTSCTKSRVLATTQSSDVASCMCAYLAHGLKDLSDADAWELFKKTAFANKTGEQLTDLEDVGRRILSKCKGLPLAVRTMGSMLGSMNKKSEWESVERSEIWGLSVGQSKIMPWLLLSFHHLPYASIKQCFVHCSIIIEKGTFVHQSELIRSWMAQGLIDSTEESGLSMEDVGEAYVRALSSYGLLQMDIRRDGCYLWMHDLVHDLACFISKDTSLIVKEACDLHNAFEVEHMRILGLGSRMSEYNLPKSKTLCKLRTLICTQATLSVDFAAQAMFLRDLRLIGCGIKEVPSSIGRLKHLKYLSLRGNGFRHLPESIGTLFSLQTIDLRDCDSLVELPQAITLLFSLRHIVYIQKWSIVMPEGMGQLTCLRTIPGIQLQGNVGFQIQELKNLPLLCGDIVIDGLQHVSCKEDALEASLITKAGISYMRLHWASEQQETDGVSNDEEIMDGLRPHSNLEGIHVRYFKGKRFSSWIPDMKNLKEVSLYDCKRCEKLPTLGQLGYLETIDILGMHSIEVIGNEFYYNDDGERRDNDEMSKMILFPQLKRLDLSDMYKLRDWFKPSGPMYELFPCLETITLLGCYSLTSFPSSEGLSSLRSLSILGCTSLSTIAGLESCVSLETLILWENAKLGLIPDLRNLTRLTLLILNGFSRQMTIPEWLSRLSCLRELEIGALNEELEEFGEIKHLPKCLKFLTLVGWPKLKSLPTNLRLLNHLESLAIKYFGELETLPEWLGELSCLQQLYIESCRKLTYMPSQDAIGRLTKLRRFYCLSCPLLEEDWSRVA